MTCSKLLCGEPATECGASILQACQVTAIPLDPEASCTASCKASFGASICSYSSLVRPLITTFQYS
eukprot:scaffold29407_cov38-Prasinocladus_malaysianus.AAC.1